MLTNGAGNFASWVHRFFRHHGLAKGHKTQLAPTGGLDGLRRAGGHRGQHRRPAARRFTIAGDGDFLMNGQELATAAQYGAKTHHRAAEQRHVRHDPHAPGARLPAARAAARELANPDFVGAGPAYGYAGARITRTAEFEPELLAALERQQGTLIEVMLDPEVITTRGTLSAITQAR